MPIVQTQFPPVFDLTKLNGQNGFCLTRSTADIDFGGVSVSSAGDINADGIDDLVVGIGREIGGVNIRYVVFGKKGERNALLSLNQLNGVDGFNLTGETHHPFGQSVSAIRDINRDGISDLILGANYASPGDITKAGTCYVVFGKKNIGKSGAFDLTKLNGLNGFSVPGLEPYVLHGWSVSDAGDVNDDGISDLIIGDYHVGLAGASYVVFGSRGIGSSGIFDLASLNGINGFKLLGVALNDETGWSVSNAGDVNADGITDLIIGAPGGTSLSLEKLAGISYVVFGNKQVGGSGTLYLESLNGTNGFKLYGDDASSQSGYSVSSAGDINGDGISDLIIGAPYATLKAGLSYVVFGNSDLGSSGSLDLFSVRLRGAGFEIGRAPANYESGLSVSKAGDFNGDGISDLIIGAPGGDASYIIFGNRDIVKTNVLDLSALTGVNGVKLIAHPSGFSVDSAGDINGDGISDVIIGGGGGRVFVFDSPCAAYVVYGEKLTIFSFVNHLTVNEGHTVVLSTKDISATNPLDPSKDDEILFSLSAVQRGNFASITRPAISLTSFSQKQIRNGEIQFTHDGSGWAPSYNVSLSYGKIATTSPQPALVAFQQSFALVNNRLSVRQYQKLTLSSSDISANDLYNSANNPNLIFSISNVKRGLFSKTSFTQRELQYLLIQFTHDGSTDAPSFNVSVINGVARTSPQPCVISFSLAPIIVNNTMTIYQGQILKLTTNNLSAESSFSDPSNLLFTTTSAQGHFELASKPGFSISSFMQRQVWANQVQFVHDCSTRSPAYSVNVNDGVVTTPSQYARLTFKLNQPPVLINNRLLIEQGTSVILTPNDLSATVLYGNNLTFTVSEVQHGYFASVRSPSVSITRFTQAQVQTRAIEFITDGGPLAPGYRVAVSDRCSSSPTATAVVTFIPSQPSDSSSNTVRNAIIGSMVSGGVGLLFLGLKLYLTHKATQSLQKVLKEGDSEIEIEQRGYYKQIVQPIVNRVFERIQTSGFLGYRSEKNVKEYVAAIEDIISKLAKSGININLKSMLPSERSLFINEIARQVKKQVGKTYSYCSKDFVYSFFRPEVTPEELESKVDSIVDAIIVKLKSGKLVTSEAKTDESYTADVVKRFADTIFERFAVSGICDCRCVKKDELTEGVESIVEALKHLQIKKWDSFSGEIQEQLLTETANQTSKILKPSQSRCKKFIVSMKLFGQITFEQLEEHAEEIAQSVKDIHPDLFNKAKLIASSSQKPAMDKKAIEMLEVRVAPDPRSVTSPRGDARM